MGCKGSCQKQDEKSRQPADEQTEVEADGGEDGVDAVAVASFEEIASHAAIGLEMADNGLHCGAALHLSFDGGGGSSDLAGNPDAELVRLVMAAIASVDMDAADLDAGVLFNVVHCLLEGMPIEGIPV